MNLPNKLTLFRIFMVIPFSITMSLALVNLKDICFFNFNSIGTISFFISGIFFILAMVTDYIDGYLARKNNQVTTFGKLFDPLADKIMTTTALIFLSLMNIVPFYITLIFILRDVCVDGFRNLAATKQISISASKYGKIKTMFQSIGIIIIFFIFPIWENNFISKDFFTINYSLILLNLPLFIAAILSIFSGFLYFVQIKEFIKYK